MYKILTNLPKIPSDLIEKTWHKLNFETNQDLAENVAEFYQMKNEFNGYASRTVKKDGAMLKSSMSKRSATPPELTNWINENITSNYTESSISITDSNISNLHAPHVDHSRRYLLIYVLQSGGPDVVNQWYKEKTQPLKRFGQPWLAFNDYDQLEVVGSLKIPENTWAILDSQIIHSVENLINNRVTIQIGILSPSLADVDSIDQLEIVKFNDELI